MSDTKYFVDWMESCCLSYWYVVRIFLCLERTMQSTAVHFQVERQNFLEIIKVVAGT